MELEHLGGLFAPGYTLSLEERAVLEVEMAKRKAAEKLASIKFWGRLQGTTGDYLVVYGMPDTMDEPSKKWYYATSKSLTLKQFPDLTEPFAKLASTISGRFLGNPAKLLGPDADAAEEADEVDEEGNPKPKAARFSEAHRLAYVVSQIEHDTGVVPKGAFVVTPTHHIAADVLFSGLSATDAGSLGSYYHFRRPEHPHRRHALHKQGSVDAGAWMDPVSEDGPEGVWRLQVAGGKGQVSLRSLKWPGYFFFAAIASPAFGGVYVGDGRPNEDLQFMM